MLDLKICGGRIVDGTGAAAFVGDIGIDGGRAESASRRRHPIDTIG